MEISTIFFYVLATVLVASGLLVITSRNAIHSALFLVLAFFTSGAIWMMLHAEFLAIAIVLIYVGAVMVLFLFVVMMLDINIDKMREGFWRYLPVGLIVALVMVGEMAMVLNGSYFHLEPAPGPTAAQSNTQDLAREMFTNYAYPFEIASLILLVAMIAAVALTFRRRQGLKNVDPAQQIAVKAADRMRIVSMPSAGEE
ncbi:NADH-quinone oxidoreductase subunit J [Uliginosibacterium sp. H3]|uniref:NADH-quinone oxidoreductase subunit J n=1 Tax=Uliginosibacterium silvisoli TaxID=3114758 RepID=A0ABU6K5S0_9RHOO|nr:NADH-quinone oxidoreductase subunit J [Uliginosibacterium sp. H3]